MMNGGMMMNDQTKRKRWTILMLMLLLLSITYVHRYRSAKTVKSIPIRIAKTNVRLPQQVSFEHGVGQDYDHIAVNSNFGFQRVYLINQARRRDRLTEMQLLLEQYSIPFTTVEAIDGAKEMPTLNMEDQVRHGKSQSHARIWQMMLAGDVKSALILEDTFDMDVRIKEQMQRLQAPFAALLNIAHNGRNSTYLHPRDPWNTALWDLLWFGQCEERPWSPEQLSQKGGTLPAMEGPPYVTYRDPTRSRVAHHSVIYSAYGVPANDEENASEQRLRIIQPAQSPRCTTAYAITKHGAARALYQSAHKSQIRELDVDLQELLKEGRLRAYTVIPSLFARRFGKSGSSNDGASVGDAEWHNVPVPGYGGRSHGIDLSARKNLLADILGQEKVIVRQKSFLEYESAQQQPQQIKQKRR